MAPGRARGYPRRQKGGGGIGTRYPDPWVLDRRSGREVTTQFLGDEDCPAGRATAVVDAGRLFEVAMDDGIGVADREFAVEGTKPA